MKTTVLNPQNYPCWEMMLTYMMDTTPETVMALYRESLLMEALDLQTGRLVHQYRNFHSLPTDVQADLLAQFSPFGPQEEEPTQPLTEEEREEIWAWVESLPDDRKISFES